MSKETEIKEKVFEKIRKGQISMRPRTYFILRVAVVALVSVIAFMLAILVLSFAFFSLHESGEQFLLGFGQRGLGTFVALFPWWSLLFTVFLILLLDYLLRYFKFGYRVSMLEIFLIALAVVVAGGIAINFTPLHSLLLDSADHDDLPVLGTLYEEIHDSHQAQGVYRGIVSSVQGTQFVITHNDNDKDSDEGTSTIVAPTGFDTGMLHVGERVYVAGKLINGLVYAYGIEDVTADSR